jgi:hypothetical protein
MYVSQMKTTTCILLSISILFVGCFTESSITRDELAPDDSKVFFYLKDGSYIKSYSDQHQRVEGGYHVSGTIIRKGESAVTFDGLVLDRDIDRFGVDEFNVVGTLLGVGLVGTLTVYMISASGFSLRW